MVATYEISYQHHRQPCWSLTSLNSRTHSKREKERKKNSVCSLAQKAVWTPGEVNERVPGRARFFSARKHKRKTSQRWRTVAHLVHHDGRHSERQPRRAAQPISSADSGERSVAARWSWAAPGMSAAALLSPPQQLTLYKVGIWNIGNTPSINRRSILEAPLCFICIGYHWISSDLSGKVEKWSNCEMRSNIMHE
jgi:hypothetical protein